MISMAEISSEIVERVAIALYASSIAPVDGTADEWPGETNEVKAHFRDHARVAIAAMREPTNAMYAAAIAKGVHPADTYASWKAMIEEALK